MRRALAAALSLCLVGGLAGGGVLAPAAQADTVKDRKAALDKKLAEVREDLEGANRDLVEAAVTLERSKVDLADAEASLNKVQIALAAAKKHDAAVAERLAVSEAAVAKARRDLLDREARVSDSRAMIGNIAREAYVNSGMGSLSIVLNASSPGDFADQVAVAGTALRRQNGTIARLEVQQAETRARQEKLNAALTEVAVLKSESGAVVAQRLGAEQEASTAEAAVHKIVEARQVAVIVIAKRKAAEKKRLAALATQQRKLASILRARSGKSSADLGGNGKLSYPVNAPITSGYGMRFHPVLHYYRLHAGTDFGAPCGTPVRAPASGKIVRAGWAGGYGNQVLMDFGRVKGKSLGASMNHLSRIVKYSGHVSRGQVVAYSGTTGLSTGCHLHFEVYVNGSTVNPMSWL